MDKNVRCIKKEVAAERREKEIEEMHSPLGLRRNDERQLLGFMGGGEEHVITVPILLVTLTVHADAEVGVCNLG